MMRNTIVLIIISLAQIAFTGCSDRIEVPVKAKDGTLVYQSKTKNGIEAQIIFCEKISRKTGKPIKPGFVFPLKEKSNINAVINLSNRESHFSKTLMFHVNWLDSTGNSIFKKRIDLSPDDTSTALTSAIGTSPDKRNAGEYVLRVYLFRELIAEKKFQLIPAKTDSKSIEKKNTEVNKKKSGKEEIKKKKVNLKVENIAANITMCRYISKKNGKLIGADSTFTIKDKGKVKAVVNIENRDIKTNQQMNFYFEWVGPDDKSFYRKKIVYTTSNPSFTISNSISITPEKRLPGNYTLRIIYRKKIIAEKKFELVLPE